MIKIILVLTILSDTIQCCTKFYIISGHCYENYSQYWKSYTNALNSMSHKVTVKLGSLVQRFNITMSFHSSINAETIQQEHQQSNKQLPTVVDRHYKTT